MASLTVRWGQAFLGKLCVPLQKMINVVPHVTPQKRLGAEIENRKFKTSVFQVQFPRTEPRNP
eukprot:3481694-Rhodomonas_salina.1